MKINLRFGMHRDIEVIHQESDKIDGLVIPAHILAHQTASTAVFVTSLPRKAYVIDPMTYMFQHAKSDWLNEKGEVRVSLRKMCEGYDGAILGAIEGITHSAILRPDQLPSTSDLCKCVSQFQLTVISRESATSKAAKYLKRYGATLANMPRAVLPPYFFFDELDDDWYRYSLGCALQTLTDAGETSVMPVIACTYSGVDTAKAEKIAKDYGDFSSVMLWAGKFIQSAVQVHDVVRIRRVIKAFQNRHIPVEIMYGGYLSILMKADGVREISHGILYTEHKGFEASPGGGGVPDRYYIPAFHEFRSLSQTDLILHKHPELMCVCPICTEVLRGNPDNFIHFADNPDLLRRHFLSVRRREADLIETTTLGVVLADLNDVHGKYHSSISSLPNPDAVMEPSRMRGLDYLRNWVDGIQKAI